MKRPENSHETRAIAGAARGHCDGQLTRVFSFVRNAGARRAVTAVYLPVRCCHDRSHAGTVKISNIDRNSIRDSSRCNSAAARLAHFTTGNPLTEVIEWHG